MRVESSAFEAGAVVPKKHTGEGEDVSPPLAFHDVPEGAKELALVCDDPDAPVEQPWVHWVLYGLPASTTELEEGSTGGGKEGGNDFGNQGYGGPMPPVGHGTHRYHFKLYALDAPLDLDAGASKTELLSAMQDHILEQAELIGTYERK